MHACNLNSPSSYPTFSSVSFAIEQRYPHPPPLVDSLHEPPLYLFLWQCCKWKGHSPRQPCVGGRHATLLSCGPAPGYRHLTPPTVTSVRSLQLLWLLLSVVQLGVPLLCCCPQGGHRKRCASLIFCLPSLYELSSSSRRRIYSAWRYSVSLLWVHLNWDCLGYLPDMTIFGYLYYSSTTFSFSSPLLAHALNLPKICLYDPSSAGLKRLFAAEIHQTPLPGQPVVRTSV